MFQVLEHRAIDAHRCERPQLLLKLVGAAFERDHDREAERLASVMARRRQVAQSNSTTQESMRKAADADWKRAAAAWKKAQYHTVRRGDALGSVATQWNTTPEELIRLNKLPNNRIKIEQTLLVRQAM